MPVIGRRDDHRVDIFAVEQLAVVCVAFAPCAFAILVNAFLKHVAHRDATNIVAVRTADEIPHVPRTHAADADHAEVDAIIRTQNLGGRRLRGNAGPYRCRRRSPHGDKITTRHAKSRLIAHCCFLYA